MKKGEASGPQKRARRSSEPEPQEEVLDGEQEVVRGDDDTRARAAWDAVLQRTAEEAQRISHALELLPAGDVVRKVDTIPLEEMRQAEQELTKLRVFLEQTGDLVQ